MNIATWAMLAYLAMLGKTLFSLFYPPTCGMAESPDLCVFPHIAEGEKLDIFGYASPDPLDRKYYKGSHNAELVLAATDISLTEALEVSLTVPAARYGIRRGNNSLHAHLYIFRASVLRTARVKSTALVDGGSAALNGPAPGQELLTYLNAPLTRYLPLRRRGSKKSLLSASGPKPGDPIQAGLPAAVPADADAIEELSGAGSCASGLSDEDGSCSIEPQLSAAADADGPVSADEAPVAPAADKGGSAALSPEEAAAAAADAALEAAAEEEEERIAKSKTPVPHLRGQIKLITASPQPIFRKEGFPQDLNGYIDRSTLPHDGRARGLNARVKYVPLLKLDDLGTTRASWRPLSRRVDRADPKLNLTIVVHNMGSFSLLSQLEMSMRMIQDKIGLSEEDVDEIKNMISSTSLKWYALTTVVSVLHSFFAYMAFKNDIGFWKAKTSLEGLSMRTYFSNFVCSVIIFLKLLDGNTSQLILVEMGISTMIEGWKVSRILRRRGMWSLAYLRGRGAEPRKAMTDLETATDNADARAMQLLSYILYPAVACLGVYSLLYWEHRSWWSWAIQTAAHGVYMFGFVAMTPQLYINYRLKSVAHLPWRTMMYKVFNTFIDDVFAFSIAMPLSHRIACFRDDIIFFIFLYQFYLYPVDKTRPNEYGRAYEDAPGGEAKVVTPAAIKDAAAATGAESAESKAAAEGGNDDVPPHGRPAGGEEGEASKEGDAAGTPGQTCDGGAEAADGDGVGVGAAGNRPKGGEDGLHQRRSRAAVPPAVAATAAVGRVESSSVNAAR